MCYLSPHGDYGRSFLCGLGRFGQEPFVLSLREENHTKGRLEEALAENQKALELDPIAPIISTNVGAAFCFLERYDDAIENFNRSLALEPKFIPALLWLCFACALKGDFDEALAWQGKLAGAGYPKAQAMTCLALIQARAGRKDEALRSLDSAMKLPESGKIPVSYLAWVFAALHDEDRAFEWLEKAVMQHDNEIRYINANPWFKELRGRPRFVQILQKMDLDKHQRV